MKRRIISHMLVRRFSAGTLLALSFASFQQPLTIQRLSPQTLAPVGAPLRLAGTGLAYPWTYARHGDTLVFLTWQRKRSPVLRLLDDRTLRVTKTIRLRDHDVCGVTFDRGELVVLAAKGWCWAKGPSTLEVQRLDPSSGRVLSTRSTRLRPFVIPISLAFGDGHAYVARANTEVDDLDLRTGKVVAHRTVRALAKGGNYVRASWLGDHRLGLDGTVVDVRTWKRRTLASAATGLVAGDAGSSPTGGTGRPSSPTTSDSTGICSAASRSTRRQSSAASSTSGAASSRKRLTSAPARRCNARSATGTRSSCSEVRRPW